MAARAETAQAARKEDLTGQGRISLATSSFCRFSLAYVLFLIFPVLLGLRMSFFNWSLVGTGARSFWGSPTTGSSSATRTSGPRCGTRSCSRC